MKIKKIFVEYMNEEELPDFDVESDFAKNIADKIADELEDQESNLGQESNLDEALSVVGALGYVLLSNTVANMVSKIAKTVADKYEWDKTGNVAKQIYDWSHKNEKAFQAPIKKVLALFLKGESVKYIDAITEAIYGFIILAMAMQGGSETISAVKGSDWGKGMLKGLKTSVKGVESASIFRTVKNTFGIG